MFRIFASLRSFWGQAHSFVYSVSYKIAVGMLVCRKSTLPAMREIGCSCQVRNMYQSMFRRKSNIASFFIICMSCFFMLCKDINE